jgi:hypothetical protein
MSTVVVPPVITTKVNKPLVVVSVIFHYQILFLVVNFSRNDLLV